MTDPRSATGAQTSTTGDAADSTPRTGSEPWAYTLYQAGGSSEVDGGVIAEAQVCLSVNGREFVTFMCSPIDLPDLALGFLATEGIIKGRDEVHSWRVNAAGDCVDVWLHHDIALPKRAIKTSGCGGGVTFEDFSRARAPMQSLRTVTPNQIVSLMRALNGAAELYHDVRGVHTSALSDGDQVLHVAQDIGRHNTIDRLRGITLRADIDTSDMILLASGRISSEMLSKAANMGVAIVCSRTSPTSLSVRLAEAWNMTVIGYVRGGQFRVYTAKQRVSAT